MPRDKRAFVVGRRFLALLGMTEKVKAVAGVGVWGLWRKAGRLKGRLPKTVMCGNPIKPLAGLDAAKQRKAGADIGAITRHSERGRQAERRISCVSCRLGWTDEALYPYAARQASFCGWQEIPRVARNDREGTHGAWARRGSPSGRLRLPPPSPEGGKGVFAAMWRVVIAGRRSGRGAGPALRLE